MGEEGGGLYVGAGEATYEGASDVAQWVEMDPAPGAYGDQPAAHGGHTVATEEHAAAAEGVGSARWVQVRTAAGVIVRDRLQVLTFAVQTGVRNFQRDSDGMIDEYIKEPPPKPITGLGAIVDALGAACAILIPEATLAAEIFETAKTVYETLKPAVELKEKLDEQVVARSVEDAKAHLKSVARELADEADNKAPLALDQALGTVNRSLDAYITAHPQPLQDSDEFYGALSDGIGIRHMDPTSSAATIYNAIFPPFKKELLRATASLHFFHEMDNDIERLDFLIGEAEKGNDPDALLVYIGADKAYWDRFLTVYRSSGRDAAVQTLQLHLMTGA